MLAHGFPDFFRDTVGFFYGLGMTPLALLSESKSALRKVDTHCSYCAVQCGLTLSIDELGRVSGGQARRDFEVNAGRICVKGATAHEQVTHPERLLKPLVLENLGLEPVTWTRALDVCASEIRRIQSLYGSSSVAVFGSGALTNEAVYLLGKFARVALATPYIDYNGRFCMASGAAANRRLFGLDRGLSLPLSEIPETDCIILAGSNLQETLSPLSWYFQEARRRGASIITIDPRKNSSPQALGTLHLAPKPGTDLALALGLMRVLIHEGYCDTEFIGQRSTGFEAMAASCEAWTPEAVEASCGVPALDLVQAARLYGQAKSGVVLTARGVEQHVHGADAAQAYFQLMVATGKIGRRACGGGCLTGQGNGQGGREHGQKADQLPGYRDIRNLEHRQAMAQHWGIPEKALPGPGVSAVELFDLIHEGKIKALLVFGSNPAVSFPDAQRAQAALKKLELLVCADLFLSETAAMAHVVFPVASFAEKSGTMTNLEGRVVLRRKAAEPSGEAKPDDWILCELAGRLGQPERFPHQSPEDLFDELARSTRGAPADYSGMSHERLGADGTQGLFWPCPDPAHPGSPRIFEKGFGHADGKAHFSPLQMGGLAEASDARYPLQLTTGRVMAHYLSGSITRRIARLNRLSPHCFAEISPAAALKIGVVEGGMLKLQTRRGQIILPAKLNPGLRDDTVFVPFHWGGADSVNLLTLSALDPISKMPSFKACAVSVEAHQREIL